MYIYGKNVAREAIMNNKKIIKAIIYKGFNDKEIISSLQKLKISIKFCEKFELDKLAPYNHQGIILNVPDYEYKDIDDITKNDDSFVVMLDHIEDPHNLGAIIRTCEAAGVSGVIIPKDRCAIVNDTVIKTSAGALASMDVCMATNLAQTIRKLKEMGFWIIGTDMVGEDYSKLDYKGKICLVIGNEGNGMSNIVKNECDFLATIPMNGKINSLNASVATGIVVFEAIKQRR